MASAKVLRVEYLRYEYLLLRTSRMDWLAARSSSPSLLLSRTKDVHLQSEYLIQDRQRYWRAWKGRVEVNGVLQIRSRSRHEFFQLGRLIRAL